MKNIVLLLTVLSLLSSSLLADDAKAREIMQKVKDRDDGDNSIVTTEMILIDAKGNQRSRLLKRFNKDVGEDVQSIMFFLSPADVKDTGFLSYDYEDGSKDDDQWLYLPALKKVKRIASSDKSGSFMGSDFTYADMTQRDLEDYDFKIIKELKVNGKDSWAIESTPKNARVLDETGYTKSILFIQKDIDMLIRAIHYVQEGKKAKYQDVKRIENIDGILTAVEIHMTTKKGKRTLHKTIIRQTSTEYNKPQNDNFYNVRTLERGL